MGIAPGKHSPVDVALILACVISACQPSQLIASLQDYLLRIWVGQIESTVVDRAASGLVRGKTLDRPEFRPP